MNVPEQRNSETAKLIALVEKETGYCVTVGSTDSAHADAEMISAAPEHPAHLINVSTRCLAVADYIVAVQCVMLLSMWSHPEGVPALAFVPDKLDYAIRKAASHRGFSKLPAALAEQAASNLVTGLLHQLRSTPAELTAMEYCHRECPGLRRQQADAMAASLRCNLQGLKPEIKEMSPPDIWTKNQTMCAALARVWCDLVENDAALLPYKAIGVESGAQKMVEIWRASKGTWGERNIQAVDGWAAELGLKSLYSWTFRKK